MTAATRPRSAQKRKAQSSREAWLIEAMRELRPVFKTALPAETVLPAVRVSVGWPGGKRKKGTTLGQCWTPTAAADGLAQIFISPIVSDGRLAVTTLAHEFAHAIDKNEHGHDRPFAAIAYAIGLEGKPTETHAGADLAARAEKIVSKLGKYPHAELTDATDGTKKQTTRMLKIVCECPTPRILRLSQKAIDLGPITCGVCEAEFAAEDLDDDGLTDADRL